MPSILDPNVPVGEGLRSVVSAWLDGAASALAGGGAVQAVHEARKACKRARAALHLVGGKRARALSAEVAAAARWIAPVRDADVLRALIARQGWSFAVEEVPDREDLAARAAAAVREARRSVDPLRFDRVTDEHVDVRLVRSWRSARRALWAAAEARNDDPAGAGEQFHAWRKKVKRLHAQSVLLSERHPKLGAPAQDLDSLQDLLGSLHDLTVLRDVAAAPGPHLRELDDEIALHEQRALAEGRATFALRPSEFASSLA